MPDLLDQIRKGLSDQDKETFDTLINNFTAELKADLAQVENKDPEHVPENVAQRALSISFSPVNEAKMDKLLENVYNAFRLEHSPRLESDHNLNVQNENVLQAGNVGRKIANWELKNLDTPAINSMRDKRNKAFRDAINDPNKSEVAARAELAYRLALKAAPKLRPEAPAPRYEAPRPTPKLKPAGM